MTRLLSFLFAAMLLISHSAAADSGANTFVLLIGVNKYPTGITSLDYCVRDTEGLAASLQKVGVPAENIIVMVDNAEKTELRPSRMNIQRQIELITDIVTENDQLVVTFSGHGAQIDDDDYLCPNDIDLDKQESFLSRKWVYEKLEKSPARKKLFIADCCRNEIALPGARSLVGAKSLADPLGDADSHGFAILASCSRKQRSYEDETFKHGVFTYFIMQGLEGAADANADGRVTFEELYAYVLKNTRTHVLTTRNKAQVPVRGGEFSGEFVLAVNMALPVVTSDPEPISEEVKAAAEDFRNMNFDAALTKLEAARAKNPDLPPAELIMAQWFSQVNELRASRQMIEKCVTKSPKDPEAYVVLADLNLQNGCFTEAEVLYAKTQDTLKKYNVSDKRKTNITRRYQTGITQISDKRSEVVTKLPMAVLREAERNTASVEKAASLFHQGKIGEAVANIEAVRAKDPNLPPTELIMAQWYSQMNELCESRLMVERSVIKFPKDPEAYVVLADLNLQNGCYTEAELLYAKTTSTVQRFTGSDKRKKNIIRRYQIGMAQIDAARGRRADAIANLDVLLKAEPDNVAAWSLLGMIQFQNDNVADAIKAFEKAKNNETKEAKQLQAEARVAMLYQNVGNDAKAKEYMTLAIEKAPRDVGVRLAAAQWSLQMNNVSGAAVQAKAALTLESELREAQMARGVVALHESNFAEAEKQFAKVLVNSPSDFVASNFLALALCEQNDPVKLKKAEEYAKINVERYNKAPDAFATAAWVLYKKDDLPNAQQFLQNAIRLANGQISPDTGYYLAAIYAKSTDTEVKNQAKGVLNKILENKQPFYKRADAEKLLKTLP